MPLSDMREARNCGCKTTRREQRQLSRSSSFSSFKLLIWKPHPKRRGKTWWTCGSKVSRKWCVFHVMPVSGLEMVPFVNLNQAAKSLLVPVETCKDHQGGIEWRQCHHWSSKSPGVFVVSCRLCEKICNVVQMQMGHCWCIFFGASLVHSDLHDETSSGIHNHWWQPFDNFGKQTVHHRCVCLKVTTSRMNVRSFNIWVLKVKKTELFCQWHHWRMQCGTKLDLGVQQTVHWRNEVSSTRGREEDSWWMERTTHFSKQH